MTAALVAGLVAGYGIAVPVGAVGSYLVTLSARAGWRRGACAALGVASADAVYAVLAVAGGSVLAAAVRPVAAGLRTVSVGVLLLIAATIAVRTLRERSATADPPVAPRPAGTRTDARAYLTFLGITLLNPLTVVYFAALVGGGQGRLLTSPGDRVAFVVAATAASASWQLLLAGGGAVLGRIVTGPRGRLVTGLVSSVVIGALALGLA